MEPRELQTLRMFPAHAVAPRGGSMPLGICGFSAGVTNPPRRLSYSTTCGSIAPENGHGWAERIAATNPGYMEPKAQPRLQTSPGHERIRPLGSTRPETYGSSAGSVTTQLAPSPYSMTSGNTAAANGYG